MNTHQFIGNAVTRRPGASALFDCGHSKWYQMVSEGLVPPPVKVSPKMAVWPLNELHTVLGAHIAGKSPDEIKALVSQLVEARKTRS